MWRDADPSGSPRVHLYFFWSQECPHCQEAKPEVEALVASHAWLVLHSLEVTADAAAARQYAETAEALGQRAQYVPGFAYCGQLRQGYPGRDTLARELVACHGGAQATPADTPVAAHELPVSAETSVTLPLLGRLDAAAWSLPVTTLVLAGLDAFNPCAFFVLLFLLSLLVHVRSRARMIAVSGVFILFSGLWYFVFMAAWLNVFLWVGELRWVTPAAGLVAMGLALLDIKGFFFGGKGPSRSIPARAKPSLYRRMRTLVQASSLPAALVGTVVLAAAANTYELLCTAGFPHGLHPRAHARAAAPRRPLPVARDLNAIYVVPLVVIAGVFVKKLGSRKLQEHEGRALKLLSGTMMLGLGIVLVVAPAAMSRVTVAVGLLAAALAITAACVAIERRRARRVEGQGG